MSGPARTSPIGRYTTRAPRGSRLSPSIPRSTSPSQVDDHADAELLEHLDVGVGGVREVTAAVEQSGAHALTVSGEMAAGVAEVRDPFEAHVRHGAFSVFASQSSSDASSQSGGP